MESFEPDYFSWILPDLLAGSGYPQQLSHLQFMVDHRIKYLVSLTEWKPPVPLEMFNEVTWFHIPIEDEAAPTKEQIEEMMKLIEKASSEGERVLMHCEWGCGRTGTMAACYFVKHLAMTANDAIQKIREIRPMSIETEVQEQAVVSFESHLKSQGYN